MDTDSDIIKEFDNIVITTYDKKYYLFKLKKNTKYAIKKKKISLDNIIGHNYSSIFTLDNKNLSLIYCENLNSFPDEDLEGNENAENFENLEKKEDLQSKNFENCTETENSPSISTAALSSTSKLISTIRDNNMNYKHKSIYSQSKYIKRKRDKYLFLIRVTKANSINILPALQMKQISSYKVNSLISSLSSLLVSNILYYSNIYPTLNRNILHDTLPNNNIPPSTLTNNIIHDTPNSILVLDNTGGYIAGSIAETLTKNNNKKIVYITIEKEKINVINYFNLSKSALSSIVLVPLKLLLEYSENTKSSFTDDNTKSSFTNDNTQSAHINYISQLRYSPSHKDFSELHNILKCKVSNIIIATNYNIIPFIDKILFNSEILDSIVYYTIYSQYYNVLLDLQLYLRSKNYKKWSGDNKNTQSTPTNNIPPNTLTNNIPPNNLTNSDTTLTNNNQNVKIFCAEILFLDSLPYQISMGRCHPFMRDSYNGGYILYGLAINDSN